MKIGVGWKKQTKDGKIFLSVKLEALPLNFNGSLMLFVNEKKQNQNHPDYIVMSVEDRKQQQQQQSNSDFDNFNPQ